MNRLQFAASRSAIEDAQFRLGIVRLSPEQRVLYANRAALEMTGNEIEVGKALGTLRLDLASRDTLRSAMRDRFDLELGSSYRICFARGEQGTQVHLNVSAVPEYDAEGQLIGSIGFLVDETIECVSRAMHEVIAESSNGRQLLSGIAARLHEILPFDSMVVTEVSQNRRHLKNLFEDPAVETEVAPTMWWPMPPFIRAMIDDFEPGPLDLAEMFASPQFKEYAQGDPGVEEFRARGFRHCLRFGVYKANALVATLSLLRRSAVPFTHADHDRCVLLPILEAVNAAIAFEEHRQLQFGFEFVRKIAHAADDSCAVAQHLAERMAQHYGWHHVAVFHVDKEHSHLQLVSQAGHPESRLPAGYRQSVALGLLGKAFHEKRAVNVGNVSRSELSSVFHGLIPGTRSELVVPIPGTECEWLVNIESRLRDAFADEEQRMVEAQLRIAGFILQRLAVLEQKSAIVRSVADAVFQTNDMNVILDANPAAEALLGRGLEELRHHSLDQFALGRECPYADVELDTGDAWSLSETGAPLSDSAATLDMVVNSKTPLPVRLRDAHGDLIPVLMSGARLPTRLGGRVFVASDLRSQNEIQRLEVLTGAFRQMASEIRVPLTLADSFIGEALQRAEHNGHDAAAEHGGVSTLLDKASKQIRKAEMPLERVMRYAIQREGGPLTESLFDLREAMLELIDELPNHEGGIVTLHAKEEPSLVRAPRRELVFCVRSLLAYLLGRRTEQEALDIWLRQSPQRALISIALNPCGENVAQPALGDGLELELLTPVIKDLMRRMRGGYAQRGESRRRFTLFFTSADAA